MTRLDEMVETFELLGDWDQRYLYLVELGEHLPAMPAELKSEGNKVKGCMSQVWLSAYRDPTASDRVQFHGDCDTSVIKGVLALLIQLVSGKTAKAVESLDVDEFFSRLELDEHLSPNRHVGVYAIVELMKQQVERLYSKNRDVA
jgi:cysteine desulfuration protein SufE